MELFGIESGFRSGVCNMALDEALLERVRESRDGPVLIVRTYQWEEPTLSLGVNQAVRDIRFLFSFYGLPETPGPDETRKVVRRPTGGRAILHGEDISYSFITNDPAVLRLSLKASYEIYARLVREALEALDLRTDFSGETNDRRYLRSPVCFETHTASDLVGAGGQKLTGSAQLRRQGGLLQHGAAFLKPYGVPESRFTRALFDTVSNAFGQALQPYPMVEIQALQARLEADYLKEAQSILASASTTSGSHWAPASC